MALAPKTVLTYPLDGANRDFQIPFEYLARKFVQVTLVGMDRKVLVLNIDYRFTQRTIVTLTKNWGPADGYKLVEIRRYTSATERLVDFSDGSILRAYDLNTSQVQSLHIAEEGRDIATDTIGVNNDGNLDARGRKIVNVADGTEDFDAVNLRQQKQWGQSALNQANRSKTEADRSQAQADRATGQAGIATNQANIATTQAQESLKWAGQSYEHRQAAAGSSAEAAKQAGLATSNGQAQLGLAKAEVQKAADQVNLATQQANRSGAEADRATQQANASAGSAGASKASAGASAASAGQAAGSAKTAKDNADKVLAGFSAFGSMPVGSLVDITVYSETANHSMYDQGFLPCNGTQFDAGAFPDLFKWLNSGSTPNLLGRYRKTSPDGSNVGQVLAGAMPAHAHTIPEHGHAASSGVAGHHAHPATAWTDQQGQHDHPIGMGERGQIAPQSTAGSIMGSSSGIAGWRVGMTGAAGSHGHTVGVSVQGDGDHQHPISIGNQVAFSTLSTGSGTTVETDRYMVFTWIKAKAPAGAAQLNALLDRIAALEAKL